MTFALKMVKSTAAEPAAERYGVLLTAEPLSGCFGLIQALFYVYMNLSECCTVTAVLLIKSFRLHRRSRKGEIPKKYRVGHRLIIIMIKHGPFVGQYSAAGGLPFTLYKPYVDNAVSR